MIKCAQEKREFNEKEGKTSESENNKNEAFDFITFGKIMIRELTDEKQYEATIRAIKPKRERPY